MNLTRYQLAVLLAFALAGRFISAAQTNSPTNTVAGPLDYTSFSRFITERNIFDPNRYPRNAHDQPRAARPTRTQRADPAFTLVGTMSYEKGMFAFFDGNNAELRQVLATAGGIAGYTVTEVTLTGATLQTADKKETVHLKIGEMMRQEGGHWLPVGVGELASHNSTAGSADSATTETASPAAASAAAPNDVLKKLMEKRQKELQ